MPGFDKRDYYAIQELWRECAHKYIQADNLDQKYEVTNTFRDSLVDIQPEGKRALRSTFEKWEEEEWMPQCNKELEEWMKNNPFEATNPQTLESERYYIEMEHNHIRYRKILQVIQDSGIGLGSGRQIKSIVRRGYNGG